jgi:hypothetical protein
VRAFAIILVNPPPWPEDWWNTHRECVRDGLDGGPLVLVGFSVDTLRNAPRTFTAMILLGVLAVVLDAIWQAPGGGGTAAERPQDAGSAGTV